MSRGLTSLHKLSSYATHSHNLGNNELVYRVELSVWSDMLYVMNSQWFADICEL